MRISPYPDIRPFYILCLQPDIKIQYPDWKNVRLPAIVGRIFGKISSIQSLYWFMFKDNTVLLYYLLSCYIRYPFEYQIQCSYLIPGLALKMKLPTVSVWMFLAIRSFRTIKNGKLKLIFFSSRLNENPEDPDPAF